MFYYSGIASSQLDQVLADFHLFCERDFSSVCSGLGRRCLLYLLRALHDVLGGLQDLWKVVSHPYCAVMTDRLSALRRRHDLTLEAVDELKGVKGVGRGRGKGKGKGRMDLDSLLGRLRDPYRCIVTRGHCPDRSISFNTTVPLYAVQSGAAGAGEPRLEPRETTTDNFEKREEFERIIDTLRASSSLATSPPASPSRWSTQSHFSASISSSGKSFKDTS